MPLKKFSDYLEQKRSIKTLLYLYHFGGEGLDSLLEKIGGSKATGMKRISELVELGLVEKTVDVKEKRKMIYRLTNSGLYVAKTLDQIIKKIEGGEK